MLAKKLLRRSAGIARTATLLVIAIYHRFLCPTFFGLSSAGVLFSAPQLLSLVLILSLMELVAEAWPVSIQVSRSVGEASALVQID
jgi:hypothetical protein